MNALQQLEHRLARSTQDAFAHSPQLPDRGAWEPILDAVIKRIRESNPGLKPGNLPEDRMQDALGRFWEGMEVRDFRDAYLLSHALSTPYRGTNTCAMDDAGRFDRILAGADSWVGRPNLYRRCYRGLVHNYFSYGSFPDRVSETGRKNWSALRQYLYDRNGVIQAERFNPPWVQVALDNRQLFTADPVGPYVAKVMQGDYATIDSLKEHLGIEQSSWFFRQLILSQIRQAVGYEDQRFRNSLDSMLQLIRGNLILRNEALAMLLERYKEIKGHPIHIGLRDHSVTWWENPWLPSNKTAWQRVSEDARQMVSNWLKGEFIEAFFTNLAQDGTSDRRRVNFWKRYVKAIDHVDFALGPTARNSRDPDFKVLKEKMKGLLWYLDASGNNNAFIMRMGKLVVVEFSDMGNALYAYRDDQGLPFDLTKPLALPVNARNSLKNSARRNKLTHKDGIYGYSEWEDHFENWLRSEGVSPEGRGDGAPARPGRQGEGRSTEHVPERPSPPPGQPVYYPPLYNVLDIARRHGLKTSDLRKQGGYFWVLTDDSDPQIGNALSMQGLRYRPGKGWYT